RTSVRRPCYARPRGADEIFPRSAGVQLLLDYRIRCAIQRLMARSVRRSVVLRRRFVVHDDANLGGASKLGPLEHLELGRRSGPTGTSGEGIHAVLSPLPRPVGGLRRALSQRDGAVTLK